MLTTHASSQETGEQIGRNIRLLLILEEVARLGVPATPSEINQRIGLPKQTLYRLFTTLEDEGFIQREHDGRSFSPGPRLRTLSHGVISSTRVRAARLMVMQALAADIGETCNLVIPDRHNMLYLDRVETAWPLRVQLAVGSRVPLHCTASGKMYLSSLPQQRRERILATGRFERKTPQTLVDPDALRTELDRTWKQGFAEDNEEFIKGMVAVATPVEDGAGRLVACLAFHAPTLRMPMSEAHRHIDRLRDAASELSQLIADDEEASRSSTIVTPAT